MLPFDTVQDASEALFKLGFLNVAIDIGLLRNSIKLARQLNITVYDACYMALAGTHDCPLITANPRHQVPVKGCNVIPLEQWDNSLNP